MVKRDHEIGNRFLDVMEVLARQAVLACGKLKEEYRYLI
jgi:aspartate racemase